MSTSRRLIPAALAAVVAVWASAMPTARAEAPAVTCDACVVVADTGRVLWARRAAAPRANASTTKMATALDVLEHARPPETVAVSATAAATGGGGLDLHAGERYAVKELLYALLLTSSNDAAVALAEHVAGSESAFVVQMNELAEALGLRGTHFVTAHGLDAPGHQSTARDLATLGFEVLGVPLLASMVATTETEISGPPGSIALENRNPLLEGYDGAIGIKTGFTAAAGNVLVAAARRNERTVVAVTMGAEDASEDARELLDLGFARLSRTLIVGAGEVVGTVTFDPGGSVPVISGQAFRGMYHPDTVTATFVADPTVTAPVRPGEPLGRVVVTSAGEAVATVEAVAAGEVGTEDESVVGNVLAGLLSLVGRVWRP